MCTELLMLKLTMNGHQQKVYWEDCNSHNTEFHDWGASFSIKQSMDIRSTMVQQAIGNEK